MKKILVFGDSNSWGYNASTYNPLNGIAKRYPYETRWPGKMQQLLGNQYQVIENCLNGRTLLHEDPYSPGRLGISSLKIALDANAPLGLVILKLGCNELKQMFNLTAGMIAFGMEQLVLETLKPYYGYPVPKVLVIAPHPTNPQISQMCFGFSFGPNAYKTSFELGPLYQQLASRLGCAFFNCASLSFTLNEIDGLHYAAEDHTKLALSIAPIVQELLS